MADVAALIRIAHERLGRPFERPADVLLVHDPMSFLHAVSRRHPSAEFGKLPFTTSDPVTPLLVDDLLHGLYATGVAFDEALLSELGTLDLSPYRLILLATVPVISESQRKIITERVAQAGRHVALLGFGAWSDGDTTHPDLATSLSGIPTRLLDIEDVAQTLTLDAITEHRAVDPSVNIPAFEAPEDNIIGRWSDGSISAARRLTDTATWWSFALPPTSPEFLRQLALTAGCHAFTHHPSHHRRRPAPPAMARRARDRNRTPAALNHHLRRPHRHPPPRINLLTLISIYQYFIIHCHLLSDNGFEMAAG